MDPLVLFFLFLIILVSGGIGILADHLGRKFGKKRLRLFKLRPKHTARLGTFLAGVVVSSLTILVVFSLSSGVRQWIEVGYASIREAQVLQAKNKQLEASILKKSQSVAMLNHQVSSLQSRIARRENALVASKKNLDEAQAQEKSAQRLALEQATKVAEERKNLKILEAKILATTQKLHGVNKKLTTLQGSYSELDKQREQAYKEGINLENQNSTLNNDLLELTQKMKALTLQANSLAAQRKQLQAEKKSLQSDVASESQKLNTAQTQLTAVNEQLRTAEVEFTQLTKSSRVSPLIYAHGQELSRLSLQPELSPAQASAAILEIVRKASDQAKLRGAGEFAGNQNDLGNPGLSDLYANFVPRTFPGGLNLNQNQQLQAITQDIAYAPKDIVLIATSLVNTFKGEPVGIDVHPYNNPLLFHAGEVLGRIHVGRDWSVAQITSQLNDFVTDQIYKRAQKAGMIPVATGTGSTYNLEPENTLRTINTVIHIRIPTSVDAVCATDIHAADPLRFKFIVN